MAIIAREPTFLNSYDYIGIELLRDNEITYAEKIYQKGLKVALAYIPQDFNGKIPWGIPDNVPFLELHYGFIHCKVNKGELRKAINLMEQHLKWNPTDDIGVRFLLNETCQKAGLIHIKYNNPDHMLIQYI